MRFRGLPYLVLICVAGCGGGGANNAALSPGGSGGTSSTAGGGASSSGASSSGASGGGMTSTGAPGLSISPKMTTASLSGHVKFTATVTGLSNTAVTWAIREGAMGGTIDESGLYSAPDSSGTFHVVATSSADASKSDSATVSVSAPAGTPPVLKPGVWTELTPAGLGIVCCSGQGGNSFGTTTLDIDPSNPYTLYLCVDELGMWKTTDGGSTWNRLGSPPAMPDYGTTVTYLDSPFRVAVDPGDSQHLYATQGVRGTTLGFWVSHDAGATWTQPQGFQDIEKTTTNDVTTLSPDPADFKHVLVGTHQAWQGLTNGGILETKDGGDTWIAHQPIPQFGSGTMGINFLYNPAQKVGDPQTWLVGVDGNGFWRTADAGAHWTQVSMTGIPHGGIDLYYSSSGALYVGAAQFPMRSTDNGMTWTPLANNGLPSFYYYGVWGDGTTLYTQLAYTGTNSGQGAQPFYSSPESDGLTWTKFNGGTQTFMDGPYQMRFDPVHRIMYSANWASGLWALKVP